MQIGWCEMNNNTNKNETKSKKSVDFPDSNTNKMEIHNKQKRKFDKNNLKNEIQKEKNKSKSEEYMNALISKKKKFYISIATFSIIIFFLIIFSTIFAIINATNTKIIPNIIIGNVNVGKKSKHEAEELLKQYYNYNDLKLKLYLNDYAYELPVSDIGFNVLYDKSLGNAYAIGRTNDFLKNNYTILFSHFKTRTIPVEYTYNRDMLEKHINKVDENLPNKLIPLTYKINGDKLIINRGKENNVLDKEQLKSKIISAIVLGCKESSIQIPVTIQKPENLDIEKIQKEITKEPKSLSYDKKNNKIISEENGISFAISLQEAKKIVSQNKQEYIIPLKITKPQKTSTSQITQQITKNNATFPDTLASLSTYYDGKDKNREINLMTMSKSINKTILMPR